MPNIPKQIHYCWFGENQIPIKLQSYMETWRQVLPDYEIIRWDEKSATKQIESSPYAMEAYAAKKYAFVSDIVRLHALLEHGGIYLDTDVEVLKNFDPLLHHRAFCGFESPFRIGSAIIGAEAHNPWIELLLNSYSGRHFKKKSPFKDLTTNTQFFTSLSKQTYDFNPNNTLQDLGDFVVYPQEFFYAKESHTDKIKITPNTIAVHHLNQSWIGPSMIIKHKGYRALNAIFGDTIANTAYELYKAYKTRETNSSK